MEEANKTGLDGSDVAVTNVAQQAENFRTTYDKITAEIGRVIAGQKEIVDGVLTCLLADGHALLEGVPGLGKTILVRTLSTVVKLDSSRIQFTPDLMPADIIGTNMIVDDKSGGKRFEFQKGPLFTNVLLADEVNRATPKTQSALLEAMAEQRVTVGTNTYELDSPYFVLATQNPLEMEGTYPLPEAQLDRFMFKLNVKFPSLEDLSTIMDRTITGETPEVSGVVTKERLLEMRQICRTVPIASHIQMFALRVLKRTHPDTEGAPPSVVQYVKAGASPRGAQAILAAARIRAMVRGESAVGYEDIEGVALPALRHRILLNFEGEAEGITTSSIVSDILESTPKT